jgi:hypothetical protein
MTAIINPIKVAAEWQLTLDQAVSKQVSNYSGSIICCA